MNRNECEERKGKESSKGESTKEEFETEFERKLSGKKVKSH